MRHIFATIAVTCIAAQAHCAENFGAHILHFAPAALVVPPAEADHQAFNAKLNMALGRKQLAQTLIARARTQINSMYRFGGTSPQTGFDCSGFINWVFSEITNAPLPRTADLLYQINAPKIATDQLKPGDLMFYRTFGNRVSHVTMYIGNRMFIHATRAGQPLRTESMDLPYWRSKFVGAKRVLASDLIKHNADPKLVSVPGNEKDADRQIFASTF